MQIVRDGTDAVVFVSFDGQLRFMDIIKKIADLQPILRDLLDRGLRIGFVPTMGALHEGHISLVEKAKKENQKVVVSIFVNPTQFNNPDDLKKYPRMPETDFKLLERAETDVIFFPDENEIYPPGYQKAEEFNFGKLEQVMEGKFRPGHFKGVAQVVSRLFEIVTPHRAYFGEKDFQQLAVIRELVRIKNFPVEIIGCPTIREADGLAMSSRNLLLSAEMRKEAAKISKALFHVREQWKYKPLAEVKKEAISMIESSGKLRVEYLEVADAKTLELLDVWNGSITQRCLTAVQAGNIRLIDNVQL